MRRYCCQNGSGSQQRSESELKELVPSHLLASPATCKRHMCTTPAPQHCHLAKHLACNRAARTAHIALTSDMTRPAQLLHASCHIRRLDVKKTWVDAALCGRRTFPRWTPPADHQLSAGAARVPSETFWRTPNLKHGGSFI